MKCTKFLALLAFVPCLMSCTLTFSKNADLRDYFDESNEEKVEISDLQGKKDFVKKLIDGMKKTFQSNSYTIDAEQFGITYTGKINYNQKREYLSYSHGGEMYMELYQNTLYSFSKDEDSDWSLLIAREGYGEYFTKPTLDLNLDDATDEQIGKMKVYKQGKTYILKREFLDDETISKEYSADVGEKIKELIKDSNETEMTVKFNGKFLEGYHIHEPTVYSNYSTGEIEMEMVDKYFRLTNINLTFVSRPKGIEMPPKINNNSSDTPKPTGEDAKPVQEENHPTPSGDSQPSSEEEAKPAPTQIED